FVITEVPMVVWHIDFSDDAFENCAGRFASRVKPLAHEAANANSSFESRCCTALFAFRQALGFILERARAFIRIVHRQLLGGGSENPAQVPDLIFYISWIFDGLRDFIA